MRQDNVPLVFYTSGSNTDAQCNIWAKAPLTQPTANGYTKVVDLGWVVVVVVSEPVHDSLHVTYRLLAPGTEPSRGPQPIDVDIKVCECIVICKIKLNMCILLWLSVYLN